MHFKDVVKNPCSVMCYIDKNNLQIFLGENTSFILSASVSWGSVLLNCRTPREASAASVLLRHWV